MNNKGINTAARLRKVSKAITEHADQFQMGGYFCTILDDGKAPGGCGTAACIAGWAFHLFHRNKRKTLDDSGSQSNDTWGEAEKLLGLEWPESDRLFQTSSWPDQFETRFDNAERASTRARIAVERINHFIKTKGKE